MIIHGMKKIPIKNWLIENFGKGMKVDIMPMGHPENTISFRSMILDTVSRGINFWNTCGLKNS